MNLMHHDTTGTQTDSARPLSRKKLKQLMPKYQPNKVIGHSLKSSSLRDRFGRKQGLGFWSRIAQKREERSRLRRTFRKIVLDDGTTAQLVPKPHEIEAMKPTVFERFSGMFANMTKKFQRGQAKGK